MNERSAMAKSNGPPMSSAVTLRMLVRSKRLTRVSLRSPQSNCPAPTSTALTCAAPRCRRQSVKPPLEAPKSTQESPVTSMAKASSARWSLRPPRETKPPRRFPSLRRTAVSSVTRMPALVARCSPTTTSPAMMDARAS